MSDADNPLYKSFSVLCQSLCGLWGIFSIVESHLQNWRQRWHQHRAGRIADGNDLVAGYSLAISDITGEHDNGWRINFPAGGYTVMGRTLDDDLDDIVSRTACWAVSQGYERFETFLFDVAAAYLHACPAKADPTLMTKFESKGRNDGLPKKDPDYWQRFVRFGYRGSNNDKVLGLLRELAPCLSTAETANDRNLDLKEWYCVVSEVRHAATHADCVVKNARLTEWPEDREHRMVSWFPLKQDAAGDGCRLLLPKEHAQKGLERFAEYAYQVLKHLSAACGYQCQLDGLRPTTRS